MHLSHPFLEQFDGFSVETYQIILTDLHKCMRIILYDMAIVVVIV